MELKYKWKEKPNNIKIPTEITCTFLGEAGYGTEYLIFCFNLKQAIMNYFFFFAFFSSRYVMEYEKKVILF